VQDLRNEKMIKNNIITIYVSILISLSLLCLSNSFAADTKKPFAVFYAVHMEAGIRSNLEYQQRCWPRLIELVKTADKENAKLTLLFNPQWAEYILKNEKKLSIVKDWQANGHEVGLHYHLVTHHDWNGYTNRKEFMAAPFYRGNVKKMMKLVNRLAAPHKIETACCGLDIATEVNPAKSGGVPVASRFIDEIDFPDEIIYDIDGFHDGVTKPLEFIFRGKKRYHLRHLPVLTIEYTEKAISEIKTANSDEIVGIATHEIDYNLIFIGKIFRYCKENNIQIRPVHKIMEDYFIINRG
jgi:hypothetical protein